MTGLLSAGKTYLGMTEPRQRDTWNWGQALRGVVLRPSPANKSILKTKAGQYAESASEPVTELICGNLNGVQYSDTSSSPYQGVAW